MKQKTQFAAALLTALALTACSNPERAKKEHFDNATKFVAAGKLQEAVVEYRNALKEDAKYGEARLKLAEVYEALGDAPQAAREYVRAADLLPANNQAQVKAATFLLLGGQFEDARTRVRPVIERDPTNVDAQLVLGRALVGLKDLDGAVREIQEAIDLDPKRSTSYSSLAAVKMFQGNQAEAKAAFEKAIEVDPRSIQARLALAFFQASTGDTVGAEASLKQALEIDPKNALALRTIAAFYVGSQRPALAEPYLKTIAQSGTPEAGFQLSDYYAAGGRYDDALAILEPFTKDRAVAGDAESRMAAVAYLKKDKTRASTLVDGVIKREPGNTRALLLKAQFLLDDQKYQEALGSAVAAVKADPKSTQALFLQGVIQDRLKQHKEAMASFNEVLRLNPRAAAAQVSLARLALIAGSPNDAVTYAEGALSNAPNNPEARLGLVRGLIGRLDTARAEQELAPLLKQYPQVATVHAVQGTLLLRKKDIAGARTAYERALSISPTLMEALAGITNVDLVQNKGPQATQRIETLLQDNPNRGDYLMLAGQVYAAQRDFTKAESALRRAIQAEPSVSQAYQMLASVLLASGKLDAARGEFDQIVQRDGKNVPAQTMAAMIVHSQNKVADAKKRYEAIIAADPTAAVAANNLAWIYAEEGQRLDEALRLAQGAAARLPKSAEVQDTMGWIYYKKELPALAVPAFQKSVEADPQNASYHYHLALALAKSGDAQRAREAAQNALKIRPNYQEAQQLLAQTKG